MSCNCSTTTATQQSCAPDTSGLERVNYFPRQIMTVDDMVAEADYFCEKLRRHNRYLHGWGVVCGLGVTGPTADGPATVKIDSGYALGPYGDEIYVADPVTLDLARCGDGAHTDPCEPSRLVTNGIAGGVGHTVFVAIKYSQCVAKPVRAMPAGCACDEQDCEYSRIRDSFVISCLKDWTLPPTPPFLCDLHNQPVGCPPCPTDPWVVLAKVTLPVGGNMQIDTKMRRQIFSTSQIQDQVIKCCCEPKDLSHDTAHLTIAKTALTATNARAITYTIVVTNNGPNTAQNVRVEDKFVSGPVMNVNHFTPAEAWTQTKLGQSLVAHFDKMDPKEQKTLTFLATRSGLSDTIINTATVTSDTADPNPDNTITLTFTSNT